MKDTIGYSPRRRRAPRRDGQSTRMVVLEAAGQVFAERGFGDATSKEICERAGANSAAVNYYFGGKENVYEEVLVEAHRQMVSLEDLDRIILSDDSPEQKLRSFFHRMLQTAISSPELWGIKIYLRELISPTPFITKILGGTVFPKAEKLRSLIQEITGLPPDSEQAQRATAFVVIPCISLIMFPDSLRTLVLPATASASEGLVEDMLTYALGGLHALKKTAR
ncbi:MAG: hypothetical protein DELT_01110 [Desulfovibrio sp.]